jgi:hypothetical protein
MSLGLLLGEDILVTSWANKSFNLFPVQYFRAVGIIDTDKGKIVGAAIFQNYTGTNVNLSYYGKNTLSAGIVRS